MLLGVQQKRLLRQAAILLTIVGALSGCAGERMAFDRKDNSTLGRIGLPRVGQPKVYDATFANPLYVLTIPGALAEPEIEKTTHNVPFTKAARSQGIDLGTALTLAIKDQLTKAGRDVIVIKQAPSRPDPTAFFDDYHTLAAKNDVDTVLDVAIISAGYRGTLVLPYRPYMWVIVRLVRPKTDETIYADRLEVDPTSGVLGFRLVGRPEASCAFSTREEMMAGLQKAGMCLYTATKEIAQAIASDLRR
jgi:hypothetical protein